MRDLRSSLALVEAGAAVLDIDAVKSHLRIDANDQDSDIVALIEDAQAYLEGRDGVLGRAFLTQQWKVSVEGFYDPRLCGVALHQSLRYGEIRIPLPPLQSVQSVKYLDASETLQTVDPASYRIIDGGGVASSLIPKQGYSWPGTACVPDAVQISFTAGYVDVEAFNAERKGLARAMLLLIGHWFQNREGVTDGRLNEAFEIPFAIERLIAPHRAAFL